MRIYFQVLERGATYRKVRAHLLNNAGKYVFGATTLIGATVLLLPSAIPVIAYTSIGGGVLGVVGSVAKPFDTLFLANPKHWVPRMFRGITASWHQTYDAVDVSSRHQLGSLAYAARNADVIQAEFPDYHDLLKLGILIGKTADILSAVGLEGHHPDERMIRGITATDVIRMLRNQKLDSAEDTALMARLNEDGISDADLAHLVQLEGEGRTDAIGESYREPVKALRRCLSSFEFRLSITGGTRLQSVASQMSRGTLRVRTSVGHNCASYLGFHADFGKGFFPRIHVTDNVGSGFMTHSLCGLGLVDGNAEHEVLAGATGGLAVIRGTTGHRFGIGMDDTTAPAIGISYGGICQQPKAGDVENGLIVSLNRNILFKGIRPQVWLFKDGQREETTLEVGDRHEIEDVAVCMAQRYITEWKTRRKVEGIKPKP